MAERISTNPHTEEEFSLPLFLFVVAISFGGYLGFLPEKYRVFAIIQDSPSTKDSPGRRAPAYPAEGRGSRG